VTWTEIARCCALYLTLEGEGSLVRTMDRYRPGTMYPLGYPKHEYYCNYNNRSSSKP
jgi:hypothetical protein